MLNVPIDRIVPLTDARDNFSRIVSDIEQAPDGMYVLTKGGKPAIALINIEFLNKLMDGKTSLPTAPPKDQLAPKPEQVKTPEPKSEPAPMPRPEPTKAEEKINSSWTGSNSPWPLPPKADMAPIAVNAPVSPPNNIVQPTPSASVSSPVPTPTPPKPPIVQPAPTPPTPPKPPAPPPPPPPPPKPPAPPLPAISAVGGTQAIPVNRPASPAPVAPNLPPPPSNAGKIPFSEPPKTFSEPGEIIPPASQPATSQPQTPPAPQPTSSTTTASGVQPSAPKPAVPATEQSVQDLEI